MLSLLRPAIFRELELARHGLRVHLRDPSSYTPIRPDLCRPGAPTSLTLGQCGEENRRQIAQFSARDAARFAEYEEQLGELVGAVDALLDHAAADPAQLAQAGLLGKVRWLRANWHLVSAGRTLSPVTAAFYELMTAPTTKVILFQSSCSLLDPGQVV